MQRRSTAETEEITPAPTLHRQRPMAGALDVQLAGNAYYFGKLYEKPTIGDAIRPVEVEDIRRSNRLLYATAILGAVIFLLIGSAVRICFFL